MTAQDRPFTQQELSAAFTALGVQPGQIVMLHSSVKAVGAVIGGPNVILQALFDVLTPAGTVMMYAGWQDIPDFLSELPDDVRALYLAQHPPFDPMTARSVRENSVLTEFLRTWPGTQRSLNPEASMVARGAQAAFLTENHALNYGYGWQSPLAKLVEARGAVLLLGTPLGTVTLLHHAEYRATLRHKNVIHYSCPILQDGKKVWVEVEDYDTGEAHDTYTLTEIVRAYLDAGHGQRGQVGQATAYLFDAAHLTDFAIAWLEARFGG